MCPVFLCRHNPLPYLFYDPALVDVVITVALNFVHASPHVLHLPPSTFHAAVSKLFLPSETIRGPTE